MSSGDCTKHRDFPVIQVHHKGYKIIGRVKIQNCIYNYKFMKKWQV